MQAAAVQASAGEVGAAGEKLPRSISVEGEVFGFTNWKIAVGGLLGPVVFMLLVMAVTGQFSKVSKDVFEQAKATNAQVVMQSTYYQEQIEKYKAKDPKADDFPAYKVAE